AARIHRHQLIDTVGVEESTVERGDPGFLQREVGAVEVTDREGFGHVTLQPLRGGPSLVHQLNHNAMPSIVRVHKPPVGTAVSGSSGDFAITWPVPSVIVSSPTGCRAANGAINGCLSSFAVVLMALTCPRATVT